MYRKKIVNGLYKLVMGIMSFFDLKLAVVLMEHKIELLTVHEDEKENDRYYDPDHFVNGNIYIKDKANPVKLQEVEDKTELISSTKYKKFFNIDIIDKIAQVSKGAITIKGWMAMLALLSISTGLNVLMFFSLAG